MNALGMNEWFVLYAASCAGLIISNSLALGSLALVVGLIGHYCVLKLAGEMLDPGTCYTAVNARKVLCALLHAVC